MKHTLPIITLTTLAAAASAQAASGLSYNQVNVCRSSQNNAISAQFQVGGNLLLSAAVTGEGSSEPTLGVAYVFKNVAFATDVAVGIQQAQWESSTYTVTARRALAEFLPGLEIAVGYAESGADFSKGLTSPIFAAGATDYAESAWSYELAYGVTKQIQVTVARVDYKAEPTQTVVGLRYNF
ncbi:MAG: hypothetical protein ACO3ND_09375 [Opitutales bacterium]